MKTNYFDAFVDFIPSDLGKDFKGLLLIQGMKLPVSLYLYKAAEEKTPKQFFIRIHSPKLLSLKWRDQFKVYGENECFLGEGKVLNPFSERTSPRKAKRKIAFLQRLMGDEKEMLLALVLERGIRGLKEREISDFSPLTKASRLRLSQELEIEGKVKILSFTPLFLISLTGFEFLCEKIVSFIKQLHSKPLKYEAPSLEKIKKRFDLHPRILSLALGHLLRSGQIKQLRNGFELSGFSPAVSSGEKEVLKKLEDMCYKGEFRSITFDELQKRFRLSSKVLHKMLSILIEKKKIIQGKDGFLLHSRWLDELIWRIQESGSKELTVAHFKEMTGLSRKYAIPLLELLDQMGVTRRRGTKREIL